MYMYRAIVLGVKVLVLPLLGLLRLSVVLPPLPLSLHLALLQPLQEVEEEEEERMGIIARIAIATLLVTHTQRRRIR